MRLRGIRVGSVSAIAALAAALALPSAASAQTPPRVELQTRLSPVIRDVPRRPQSMTLHVTLRVHPDAPSIPPPALVRSVVDFPYGAAFNGALFPSCLPTTINRHGEGRCPAGSLIGSGHAIGVGDTVRQRLRVHLYNGPGGRSVVFYLRSSNPLRVNTAFAAPLRRFHTGRWNFELTVVVPESLRVVAGVELALEEFVSTVSATRRVSGRRRGYIEAWACPPGARVPVQGRFAFLEGPGALLRSWATCG